MFLRVQPIKKGYKNSPQNLPIKYILFSFLAGCFLLLLNLSSLFQIQSKTCMTFAKRNILLFWGGGNDRRLKLGFLLLLFFDCLYVFNEC